MIYGRQLTYLIERAIPGASAQYGYHGCNRASVQVFHEESGHGSGRPLVDFDCPCEEWGGGRLDIKPSVIVERAKARLERSVGRN